MSVRYIRTQRFGREQMGSLTLGAGVSGLLNPHWIGTTPNPGPYTALQIQALNNLTSGPTSDGKFDITFPALAGEYIVHVLATTFPFLSTDYYTDNLFNTGVAIVQTPLVMPGPGGPFNCDVIRSNFAQNTSGTTIRIERR